MKVNLYNTLARQLDTLTPIDGNRVTLYTCGPTVYNYLHVGNWAAYIHWDTLVRTLIAAGYTVERTMNITDVGHLVSDADDGEDKMEKGARREGKTAWEIAEMYSEDFLRGMEQLGLIPPEHIVKATDYIEQQLALVRTLRDKGFTYQTSDGIYFDTAKFPTYADFAHLDLDALRAGARVEYNTEKRNPSDFALWKFTPTGQTRDMQWDTPADLLDDGTEPRTTHATVAGFPGWHLECSAIAMDTLGHTIDIHTGGIDHIPVHHTNEIAQSEAATGQQFANIWLHNNHIKSDGTKISKSLGNGYTLPDLAERGYSPMDYRMFVLQSQFQTEGNFTFENLDAARNRLANWRAHAALRHQTHDTLASDAAKNDNADDYVSLLAASGAMREALNNNLNTPEALRIVDEAFSQLDHAGAADIHQHGLRELIDAIDELLGLQLASSTPDIDESAKRLILERARARERKDWTRSDEIRDELAKKGVTVRDTSHGTLWNYS